MKFNVMHTGAKIFQEGIVLSVLIKTDDVDLVNADPLLARRNFLDWLEKHTGHDLILEMPGVEDGQ